ncbi:MAG: hypothetical protein AB1798_11645 [Spirochaetota bacterium]
MKKRKLSFLLFLHLFLLIFLRGAYPSDYRITINTGHNGAVNSLAFHKLYNLLFSGGEDGTVRAWNPENGELVYQLQVSHLPLRRIALNPVLPQVAVIVKWDISTYHLSVWDWKQRKKVFSRVLRELPLYIDYSPQGSFIVYSNTQQEALKFLDSRTGNSLPYFEDLKETIISSVIVSSSERTIMTYSPSGSLQYWDVKSGKPKSPEAIATAKGLTSLSYTHDFRYMAGTNGSELVVVELTTGSIAASYSFKNINMVAVNPLNDSIVCHASNENSHALSIFNFYRGSSPGQGYLFRTGEIPLDDNAVFFDLLFHTRTIYLAGYDGRILSFGRDGTETTTFSRDHLASISELSFYDNQVALATKDNIIFINSDLLNQEDISSSSNRFSVTMYPNPFETYAGILCNPYSLFQSHRFIVYKKDETPGAFIFINPDTGRLGDKYSDFSSPIVSLSIFNNMLLMLQKNDQGRILAADTLETLSEFSFYRLEAVSFFRPAYVIGGRNKSPDFDYSLLQINYKTGETVPISDSNHIVYDLAYDFKSDRLYTLGLEDRGDSLITTLKVHTGKNVEQSRILLAYPGEDYGAAIALDPENPAVFTSIGYNLARVDLWGAYEAFEQDEHIPRKLYVYKNFLFSLNSDSSIAVWDKTSIKKLLDFYIFQDRSWIALFSDGSYSSSPGAEKHIAIYGDDVSFTERSELFKRR